MSNIIEKKATESRDRRLKWKRKQQRASSTYLWVDTLYEELRRAECPKVSKSFQELKEAKRLRQAVVLQASAQQQIKSPHLVEVQASTADKRTSQASAIALDKTQIWSLSTKIKSIKKPFKDQLSEALNLWTGWKNEGKRPSNGKKRRFWAKVIIKKIKLPKLITSDPSRIRSRYQSY